MTWVPSDLAGLTLWFDADALTGLSDADPVASWTDESGNGNHAVQASSSLQPQYKTGIQNSLPVIRFDGSNDGLTAPIPADATQSFFAVLNKRSAPTVGSQCAFAWAPGPSGAAVYTDNGSGFQWYPTEASGVASIGGTPAQWNIFGMLFSASSSVTPWLNGTAGTGFDPKFFDSVTSLDIGFGRSIGVPGDYDFGEAILYDSALGTDDRQTVEGYLAHKWGLTANLPGDHPYKSSPPGGGGGGAVASRLLLLGVG